MKIVKKQFNQYRYEFVLGTIIFLYVLLFSWLSVNRFLSFNDHYYDLGIMNQTVYKILHQGRFLQTNHLNPLLAIFAPLYRFPPSPIWLLVGQTVAIAFGALAVYSISKEVIKKRIISLIFAFYI